MCTLALGVMVCNLQVQVSVRLPVNLGTLLQLPVLQMEQVLVLRLLPLFRLSAQGQSE
jgi:hypothetical protein